MLLMNNTNNHRRGLVLLLKPVPLIYIYIYINIYIAYKSQPSRYDIRIPKSMVLRGLSSKRN